MATDSDTIVRVLHYPPVGTDVPPGAVRSAAHEDINLITLLSGATAEGLELLRRDGTWMPVHTGFDTIVVDSGDMLQNVTNGLYKSTTHRVVNPRRRVERAVLDPVLRPRAARVSICRRCRAASRAPAASPKYPSITAGAYLEQRLREIGLGIAARQTRQCHVQLPHGQAARDTIRRCVSPARLSRIVLVAALARHLANGRDPYSVDDPFRKRGDETQHRRRHDVRRRQSHDGGATWQWMCEQAVGYGGMYDPDYEYTSTGAIFATTFDGLKVMRDSARSTRRRRARRSSRAWSRTRTAASTSRRPNDGQDLQVDQRRRDVPDVRVARPGNDWWQSIEVAPSNLQRVYLTGYRCSNKCTAN